MKILLFAFVLLATSLVFAYTYGSSPAEVYDTATSIAKQATTAIMATAYPTEGCACTAVYAPVCGTNGKTYGNSCEAKCAGVETKYSGECGKPETIYAKLGEEFRLAKSQTAIISSEDLEITLTGIESIQCIRAPCPSPRAQMIVALRKDGSLKEQKSEGYAGRTVTAFGFKIMIVYGGNEKVAFVVLREIAPPEVTQARALDAENIGKTYGYASQGGSINVPKGKKIRLEAIFKAKNTNVFDIIVSNNNGKEVCTETYYQQAETSSIAAGCEFVFSEEGKYYTGACIGGYACSGITFNLNFEKDCKTEVDENTGCKTVRCSDGTETKECPMPTPTAMPSCQNCYGDGKYSLCEGYSVESKQTMFRLLDVSTIYYTQIVEPCKEGKICPTQPPKPNSVATFEVSQRIRTIQPAVTETTSTTQKSKAVSSSSAKTSSATGNAISATQQIVEQIRPMPPYPSATIKLYNGESKTVGDATLTFHYAASDNVAVVGLKTVSECPKGCECYGDVISCPVPLKRQTIVLNEGWNIISTPVYTDGTMIAATSGGGGGIAVPKIATSSNAEGKLVATNTNSMTLPSLYYPPSGLIVETTCPPATLWHYDSYNKQYVKSGTLEKGGSLRAAYGYWVKAAPIPVLWRDANVMPNVPPDAGKYCGIIIEGSRETTMQGTKLSEGWNQIGGPYSAVNFEKIKGDCEVASGPWLYKSTSKRYEKTEVLKSGEGYFLKVAKSCTLGETEEPIPPLPE